MPKEIHEEVGKIIRTRTVKTFGDKVRKALKEIAGFILVIWIIGMIFGG